MNVVAYAVRGEKTSPAFAQAFAEGCGGTVWNLNVLQPGDVALFGSPARWPLLQQAIKAGRRWFYGDHGYFGRAVYYRITANGYQHDGTGNAPRRRFSRFGRPIKPWRRTGKHVLICPNSEVYFRLFGEDPAKWLRRVTAEIKAHTDRPVIVRWKGTPRPIEWDLRDCWAVVTFTSAAALDALVAGVPVFVTSPIAAAYRMGSPNLVDIESPVYPERDQFLWNLAANQWTLSEIREGIAWATLRTAEACHA